MSSKVIYERFLWFHGQVKDRKFPNSKSLAENFEITRKTAQRNIEFMKERLKAPLLYVAESRGYRYENDAWELPAYWLSEEELTSLLVSYRLASAVPDSAIKASFKKFLDQVLSKYSHAASVSVADLSRKVSVKNIAYSKTEEVIFHRILEGLLRDAPVAIEYYSPHNDQSTFRDILPLHLLQYMGTWHIIAYCALKKGLRDFVLSRIKAITPATSGTNVHTPTESIKEYIRKNFGIMNSPKTCEVCLRFAPDIAPWIAEQIWHPAQQIQKEPNGALRLAFPVADLREIRREVLKYGSQVEVLKPKELREEVKREIGRMRNVYRYALHGHEAPMK